jgi:NitT/TauT family transport system substrate-binding protein
MQMLQYRRDVLAGLAAGGASGLFTGWKFIASNAHAEDAPPETTTIRIHGNPNLCGAPELIWEELLRAEGFTDIRHIKTVALAEPLGRRELDFTKLYLPSAVIGIDSGAPITLLAGVHTGCNVLFAHEGIRSIRDLKGKKIGSAVGVVANPLLAAIAAYVGLDPHKDIEWVKDNSKELFIARKIDAYMALPPDVQELRERKIGREIVNSSLDRPWSQVFCCALAGNREFVRRHPAATKRAIRAFLKANDFCASDPPGAARRVVEAGVTVNYDYALQTLTEASYNKWRDYDIEDSTRFYALRLREAGFIKSTPAKIIADGGDWRFVKELKRELKA